MKTKTRIKSTVTNLTRLQAETVTHDIALLMNNAKKITAQMDAELLAVKQRYGANLDMIEEQIGNKFATLKEWANANPHEFGNRKSIDFISAIIGFRTGQPKLSLLNRSWNWDKVREAVQHLLPNFIRTKPEVDKEGIIAQRDELEPWLDNIGVKIVQSEIFFVEPKLSETEERKKEAK